MKYIFHTLFISCLFVNNMLAQQNILLKLVQKQSGNIKSGAYIVNKSHKFFDFDEIKKEQLEVQFCEIGQNTTCIIKDILNNTIQFYDTSKWWYFYKYSDSVLFVRTRNNPNANLLYPYMQPYGFQRTYPLSYHSQTIVEDKINYTILDSLKGIDQLYSEFKNDFIKFTIDKKLLVPIKFQNYSEEWLDSVNYNIQNMEEEISEVKLNHLNPWLFLKYIDYTMKQLPVKKIVYPEYDLNKNTVIDTIYLMKWKLLNTHTAKPFVFNIFNKKYTLLYFTYMGCIPCKYALPVLDSLYVKWNNSVSFYGIDMFDINASKIEIYKRSNKIKFDYLYSNIKEGTKFIGDELGLHTYPTFIVINEHGKIVFIKRGLNSNLMNEIENIISIE